jgi:hypothetical protein
MANSFTSGNLTITGFDTNDTAAGVADVNYAGQVFAFDNLSNINYIAPLWSDNFVFNWGTGNDANGIPLTPGDQTVTASGSGADSWTMSVQIIDLTSGAGGSYNTLGSGSESVDFGGTALTTEGNSAGLLTGNGAAQLQAEMQGLQLIDTNALVDTFGVQFTLTDTTAVGATPTTFSEYFQTACYVAGTRIATPAGETAVEKLRVGDLVATSSGVAKPVKWLGRRRYTAAEIAAHAQLRPVLIRQDALAAGMPHRDLHVSAMHSLFIDDVFIPAAALINGVSVLRSEELAPVDYIHVELEDHDVIFADGAPAETFVDDNSRLLFDNADEYYDKFGAEAARAGFCAPRIEEGFQLEAVRRRLAARAGLSVVAAEPGTLRGHVERFEDGVLQGWVMDEANAAIPVELEVLVDGESVARVLANRYRTDLDHAGLAGGRCAFTVTLPASVTALSQIAVCRVADGMRLPMPQTADMAV